MGGRFNVAAGLVLIGCSVCAAEPVYRNVYNLDAEYELDRFMQDVPWEWRDRFRSSATGIQAGGGSLNIRHFLIQQEAKIRMPVVTERLWFRFRDARLQGLERDDRDTRLEFEYRPASQLHLSLFGEPTFAKADTDVGLAARWGEFEGQSVRVEYLWPDFDTNYAYANRSINEGFLRAYRRFPHDLRMAASWIKGPWSLWLAGNIRRPWERQTVSLTGTNPSFVEEGAKREASVDLRYRFRSWTAAIEGETWLERTSIRFEPASPATDRSLIQERNLLRLSLERAMSPAWKLRAGGGPALSRGNLRHSAQPSSDEFYRVHDAVAYLFSYHQVRQRLWLEAGYLADRQNVAQRLPGFADSSQRKTQTRVKFGLQFDFAGGASLRGVSAWETDPSDAESFVSFDGGSILFQTTF